MIVYWNPSIDESVEHETNIVLKLRLNIAVISSFTLCFKNNEKLNLHKILTKIKLNKKDM